MLPRVDARVLKDYASRLPADSALRYVLMLERDEVPAADFVVKLPLYLALAGRSLGD